MSIRESPGIISFITAEEIRNMGARDLIDVLRMVPGINFDHDVVGSIGIGMRGNWGHEGKILILWDGQEMTELVYSNTVFGNHYPVDPISRIEIIRGPGWAMYGGFAELGVINIISKSAEELGKGEGSFMVSRMKEITGRSVGTVQLGTEILDKDMSFTASLFTGRGERSDRDHSDYAALGSTTYNMKEHELEPFFLNLGYNWRDLGFRVIIDRYDTLEQEGFFPFRDQSWPRSFHSQYYEIKYDVKLSDSLTITPTLNYKKQEPWSTDDLNAVENGYYEKHSVDRVKEKITVAWDMSENHNIATGVELYQDEYDRKSIRRGPLAETYEAEDSAVFAQYMWAADSFGTLILGGRYEDHEIAGTSSVPRVGWTKIWDKFHVKLLASQAFRTPTAGLLSGEEIPAVPETTTVFEIETGYQFTSNFLLTSNIYNITIKDPIVFSEQVEGYTNYEEVGTQGIELEMKWIDDWGYLYLTYSFYDVHTNDTEPYQIKDIYGDQITTDELLGFSPNKFTLNSSYRLTDMISLNPSIIYMGEKYIVVEINDSVPPSNPLFFKGIGSKSDAITFVNFNIGFDFSSMDMRFGVYNLLDEEYVFSTPYNNGGKSLPGPSREVFLKFSTSF